MKKIQLICTTFIVCTALSASAQTVGLNLDAQRESVNGSLFSWGVMFWVIIAALAGWAGVYFMGGSGGGNKDGDDKGGDDKK